MILIGLIIVTAVVMIAVVPRIQRKPQAGREPTTLTP
jgi:hypothetical protein